MFNRIKNIKLFWSDLFLLLWSVFGSLLCFEQNRFVSYTPAELIDFNIPFFICVLLFISMLAFLFLYLFFEYKRKTIKLNVVWFIIIGFLVISQAETILLTPNVVEYLVFSIDTGNLISIASVFNAQIKILHFFVSCFIVVTVSICLFCLPKRIYCKDILILAFYLASIVGIISIIYSYISDDYVLFFKTLFKIEEMGSDLKYAPVSFFGNSNLYGIFLELFIFLTLSNYHLTKNKINILIASFFLINLLFTLCKAGIFFTFINILLFVIIFKLLPYIRHNKKRIIITITIGVALLFSVMIPLFIIEDPISKIGISKSLQDRVDIWSFSIQMVKQSNAISGIGFGIYDKLIANACGYIGMWNSSITHNWCICMLGQFGIIGLMYYVFIIAYGIKTFIGNYKGNHALQLIGFGFFSLFFHSFVEDNFYLVITMVVIMLMMVNIEKYNIKTRPLYNDLKITINN